MAVQSSHVRVSSELTTQSRRLKIMHSTPPRKRKTLSPNKELDRKRLKISSDLPDELIEEEILPRLPIKSVVRLKSVCKSWLSLFSGPQFVQHHNAYQNPSDHDCLVADRTDYIVTFSRYQQTFALRGRQFNHLIGSAKGLVCVCCQNIVWLWNPAIRQSKEFHLPPLGYNCLIRAGFGFDHVTNDYKVAICYRSIGVSHLYYAVYSSHSDLWIHGQFDDVDFKIHTRKFKRSRTPNTMVKDCPYWTCLTSVKSDKDKYKVILSLSALKFDATSNKFKLLPEFCADFSYQKIFTVVDMKDLLTLMAYDPCTTGRLEIYSLDEDKGCDGGWSMMYRIGPFKEFMRFEHLKQGFRYGDDFLFYEYGNIHSYDHKTDTSKCIPVTEPSFNVCFTYTPSLVFLQGMKSIYSENQISPPLCRESRVIN
ncbi:F-box/kelch-repeat protein At3g23880-like [Apium graveolens]|uniref:F-box/kelch-repeat protein At3g23880-like n=1 Tax=Apium graveolens TaxID=4045 RepID=UPI003D79888B